MDVEAVEKVLKLIVDLDLDLESNSLMWAAVAYFGFGLVKSLAGYAVLGAVGIYFIKTIKWAMASQTKDTQDANK
ncbi:hypothetical protein LCGC14_2412420 [marine sediment metagenome]|uniref:Uncharacterized protein n=1 Tax=marine sediment metagenome TaxID=412755 RepID=A0A0F9ELJ0_9ZZZZ